jgi:two-component system, cell cycle sensor histidine kinase and response regulator CckA
MMNPSMASPGAASGSSVLPAQEPPSDEMLAILLLEDSPTDALLLEHELRKGGLCMNLKCVETEPDFSRELAALQPDLVLADYRLPGFDGLAALSLARQADPELPFIFVSGSIGEDLAIEALKMGATDYVLKDRPGRLIPAIRRALADRREREKLREAERTGDYLERMTQVMQVSMEVLAERTVEGILRKVVDASRDLTGGRCAVTVYGLTHGKFRVEASPAFRAFIPPSVDPEVLVKIRRMCADLVDEEVCLRFTDEELRMHPVWEDLREAHPSLRGLLGARLIGDDGSPTGLILVSDKAGGDFSAEDEILLLQLAALASLAIQHIEAKDEAFRRAEEAEEGKRILDALMEHIPEGVTIADAPDGRVRMTSRYGRKLLRPDTPPGEGAPATWTMCLPDGTPISDPALFPRMRAVRSGAVLINEELLIRRSDGTLIPLLCNAGPIIDADGKISGAIVVWREITELKTAREELCRAYDDLERRVEERTMELHRMIVELQKEIVERKRTEQALRRSEERYELAVLGVNDGIWDWDLETGDVHLSPRWKSMLGYEDHELPNNAVRWKKMIHPDDLEMVNASVRDYLTGESRAYRLEYRLRHRDGTYVWLLTRGTCLRNEQGAPYRFAGSHTDITEAKRTEEALRESERKYRELFEESKEVIFFIAPDGTFLDINPSGLGLLGYGKGEIEGLTLCGIVSGNASRLRRPLRLQGFVRDLELELTRKNGETISVLLSLDAIRDTQGVLTGYQGLVHDVTERKRLEQQLLQAQKMESIGILAGGVAHDFNNLMTAITGYAEFIRESVEEDDEIGSSVEQILKASARAVSLTQNLLAFSRKQLLHTEPLLVDDAVRRTATLLRPIIGEEIELSLELSDSGLTVMGDSGQLEQILINLATNARDAMPDGGRITVTTGDAYLDPENDTVSSPVAAGKYAFVEVSDTGIGMPEESLGRIFEPFYTTKAVGKGTGLGLSITYGIVKQHNGTLSVRSAPGEGTTFRVYLPLVRAKVRKRAAPADLPPPGGGETVLIAEDDATVRTFLVGVLQRAGYLVIPAVDGREAVERFREAGGRVDLLVTDVVMPKKNGREVAEEIRRLSPRVGVVFMSGYTADIISRKVVMDDGIDFVMKPVGKNDFLRKVRDVLDARPGVTISEVPGSPRPE